MATTIINNPRAVEMSVYVVRAFVQLCALLASNKELARWFAKLETRLEKKTPLILLESWQALPNTKPLGPCTRLSNPVVIRSPSLN